MTHMRRDQQKIGLTAQPELRGAQDRATGSILQHDDDRLRVIQRQPSLGHANGLRHTRPRPDKVQGANNIMI